MTHPITWRLVPPGDGTGEGARCALCTVHPVATIALDRDATGHRAAVRFEVGGPPFGLCVACIATLGDALAGWPVVAPDAPDPLGRPPLAASAPDPADAQPGWRERPPGGWGLHACDIGHTWLPDTEAETRTCPALRPGRCPGKVSALQGLQRHDSDAADHPQGCPCGECRGPVFLNDWPDTKVRRRVKGEWVAGTVRLARVVAGVQLLTIAVGAETQTWPAADCEVVE